MNTAPSPTISATTSKVDWIARAQAAAPAVAAAAEETQQRREVAPKALDALHEAELFRMLLPEWLGGGAASPMEYMQVLEVIGAADGSTAWCLGQGLGCSQAAGFLEREVAREIFGDPRGVIAWGPTNNDSTATEVDGGYQVTGKWRFASGSHNATWIGGHCKVLNPDGSPRTDDKGRPVSRTCLFPRDSVELVDTWHVLGLEGTGSDDYRVTDRFVEKRYTTWRNSEPDRREDGPLYNIPLLTLYGMGFPGLALGIARAMLDAFKDLAQKKIGGGGNAPLRENAVIQANVAQSEVRLLSSRAYLLEMLEESWSWYCRGETPPMDVRARLRAAITWAMMQAREVALFTYQAAGTNAIFKSGPFERRFRDINTVTQQGQAHLTNYEFAGQAFLGLSPGHRV